MNLLDLVKKLESIKMNSKGQGSVGLIITIGVALLIAIVYLMIYAQMFSVTTSGTAAANGALNANTNAGLALLNLSNTTLLPLTILVFALMGVVAIVLTLTRNNQ